MYVPWGMMNRLRLEHITFLEKLWAEGVVIYGATPYLQSQFPELSREDCKRIIVEFLDWRFLKDEFEAQQAAAAEKESST